MAGVGAQSLFQRLDALSVRFNEGILALNQLRLLFISVGECAQQQPQFVDERLRLFQGPYPRRRLRQIDIYPAWSRLTL